MEKTQYNLTGVILLAIFVLFLGWFFLASYVGHGKVLRIQEKTLTAHDDLLAIDGRHNANKAAVGKFGLIFVTADGGKTWQRKPSGTSKTLTGVSFADHRHGFIVGSAGTALASGDGGATWRAQASGTKDQLLGVYAQSPTQVFAVGAFGTLLSSSDGGRSWSRHELKWDNLIERIVKESGYVEPNLNAVYFSSAEIGWVVGEFGLVLHTRDGGRTWLSQRYGSDLPQLYAVQFRDERTGWAIGQAGSLIRTTDGGERWSLVELQTTRDLYDLSVEGDHGIIVGAGAVLVSNDGGSSWKAARSSIQDQWLAGVALKSSEAIAVGEGGTTRLLALDRTGSEKEKQTR
jgi:photosystem II stability/assembly factor-like uncharacterized protein